MLGDGGIELGSFVALVNIVLDKVYCVVVVYYISMVGNGHV